VRLLHVVPTYLPAWRHGGPAVAVHGLCKALAARGHEVTVFTTDVHGATTLEVPRSQPVPVDGVTVWYFPVAPPRRLYYSPALGAALAHQLEEMRRFDLVHLHSVFLWPTAAAARAAERAGVPYLVAPRGMLVGDLLRRRGRLRKRLWIRLVERRTLARAAGLHATSDLEAEEAGRLGLRLPAVYVVANGVAVERWDAAREAEVAPAVRAALARRPLLLFLGRLSWKKGLDRLVAALAQVPGATLAIAGNDEEGCRAGLERQAAAAGVAGRIVYLGPVHGSDKAALLHGADVLVLPSYSENFGNVVLEAMAAGLPVVVTPEVGLAGVVRECAAGVVVAGDPPQLAAELRGLLADASARRAMSRRGEEVARRRFGWGAVAARMEEVYGEVLAARGPRGRVQLAAGAGPS
jgi:glycosyltransferase involved in cell wall biosynthesis